MEGKRKPATVDDYLAILDQVAVDRFLRAEQVILDGAVARGLGVSRAFSYDMPAYILEGSTRPFVYLGCFKAHLGVFPPVYGDPGLMAELEPWLGPKGNLRFPYKDVFPTEALARVIEHHLVAAVGKEGVQ